MRRWKDPFPATSRSFHLRVEDTLMGLEENDMKNRNIIHFGRYNARVVAAAVIAAILLTATAVAAVIGGNALKEKLTASGAEEFASQVQDIHTQDAAEGFGLSIDEAVWEGEKLFVSYTVTVPEEGGPWLVGVYTPKMNGEKMDYNEGVYFDMFDGAYANVMGGEFAAKDTWIRKMLLDENWKEAGAQNLEMRAVFMKANRPLRALPEDYDDLIHAIETIDGQEWNVFKDSEYLNIEDSIDGENRPFIQLHMVPEVQALFEERLEKAIEEEGFDPALSRNEFTFSPEGFWALEDCWDRVHEAYHLSAEDFENTGLVDVVCERSVTTQLDTNGVQEIVYNDVTEPFHRMDGYSVEIDKFSLSHLEYDVELIFRKDGGLTDREVERFGQFRFHDIDKLCNYTLMTMDGSKLTDWDEYQIYNLETRMDGERVIRIIFAGEGIIDLKNIEQLMLVPYAGDEGYVPYLMDEAITITPIVTEVVVDPNAVWCTPKGTYYHSEQYCMGMRAAQETTAAEAEAMGKKPCPECR